MKQANKRANIEACYPSPLLRGTRVTRLGEKYIGPIAIDTASCRSLGEDQFGWFIGGVPTFERMIENIRRINESKLGGRWITVPATRHLAESAYQQWFEDEMLRDSGEATAMWHDDLVTFCVPERLRELGSEIIAQDIPVAGIILLDPNCIVHRGRGFGKGRFRVAHDRPQLLVNFRSKLAVGKWCPPLIFMSMRKAAAVSTASIARVFGLEAMHFIEGTTLRCGAIKKSTAQEQEKSGWSPGFCVSK